MKKIQTIFERNWEGDKKVINKYININIPDIIYNGIPTEKLDGINIRLTIRSHIVVRAEKRKNPSKEQKKQGIIEPWYVDVDLSDPQDQYIAKAVFSREYNNIKDGEWSAEALGEKIQGNPLNLKGNTVCIFSAGEANILSDAPIGYEELKKWLPQQKSKFGNNCGIEGIVWHCDEEMYKIKTKDF